MFQFPAFAFSRHVFNMAGFPIRTSVDHRSLASPHSFSQLTTSFVASESLGIPRTPLFASFFSSPLFSYPIARSFTQLRFLSLLLSLLVNELLDYYLHFCPVTNRTQVISQSMVVCGGVEPLLCAFTKNPNDSQHLLIVEDIGFEPMTPCLQSRCSSQLS